MRVEFGVVSGRHFDCEMLSGHNGDFQVEGGQTLGGLYDCWSRDLLPIIPEAHFKVLGCCGIMVTVHVLSRERVALQFTFEPLGGYGCVSVLFHGAHVRVVRM